MTKQIAFFFDVGSPASYLAWTQLPAIAEAAGAEIVWKPMLLGGVFKATGNRSPAEVAAKSRYTRQDFSRYAERYGVPFQHNPYFPINTLLLMRGAEAFRETPQFQPYLRAVFEAIWVEPRNLNEPEELAQVLAQAGFDPAQVLARAQAPEVKARLKVTTEEAVARGVFGAPTFLSAMICGSARIAWIGSRRRYANADCCFTLRRLASVCRIICDKFPPDCNASLN
ncbi:2-hydroxychromene-2-carboxylate isomerase [Alkalilimnicola ehrlichii]|uniref:2-hydroxychromene-2-carboxylate isomerase n=1 Tax=Alkalilimnicola ehrlichii TaxID=351052 RepID=UPI001C6EAB84|nr:2-hydroxychromene-2-carboxylate isomerase [Alkalilimnicola ehrlichii]